jgi:hypothetical protein
MVECTHDFGEKHTLWIWKGADIQWGGFLHR